MKPKFKIGLSLRLSLAFALCVAFFPSLSGAQDLIRVVKGKSSVLKYGERIKTISIANQDVADVVSITATDLVVIGKNEGVTSVIVWGESGRHTAYDLKVDRNISGKQVVLEVQVAEINKTKSSDYGVDFLFQDSDPSHIASGDKIIGSYGGAVTSPDPESKDLFIPDGTTGVIRWLGSEQKVMAAVKALQRDGKIKLLATPRLLCLSNQSASFLVGGEIPVPVAQSGGSGGVLNITIEWKEYGVKLNFLPNIVDTNLVNLKISPEVSSLDYANIINFGGYSIPAIRTRKADATIELNSSQSVVLGGLLSTEEFKTIRRVPILGHIPLLSFFFSRREISSQETELMIIVTPRIIDSIRGEVVPPLPTDGKKD